MEATGVMPFRILHAHSTFALGGKETRAARLMNAFGDSAAHTVISAVPGAFGAREAIARGIAVEFPADAPPLAGAPTPSRLYRLARYMRRFDLVLTYNWGAMDAVMACRLLGGPPLVHHEDGFNEDEVERLNKARNRYRRIALGGAYRVIVPSKCLEEVALKAWKRSADRVVRIPNGIPVQHYAAPPQADAIPGLSKPPGEILIGTLAGLRAVKNLPRLVRAFAAMTVPGARLVIVGSGPESERIAAEARRLGVVDRVLLPGFLADPARYLGLFDVFALSSDSEQFPISLVEAMAAGLPVVATDVGDVPDMVSADNLPLIVHREDEAAFAAALDSLAERGDLRGAIGLANREKAIADYDEARMIARYAAIYGEAIGQPEAFTARTS